MLSMTQYFDADAMPSVIIMVLEQPDFRPQDSFEYNPILLDVATIGQNRDVIGIANVTRALLGERMTFSQIMQPSPDHLGLAAISFNYGFRFDGSFELSQEFLDAIEERRNSHWQAFQERSASYFFEGTGISSQNLSHLENLLQWASDQGIYVIGYYPPFSQTIYDAMMESGEYTYIPDSGIALNDLFNAYEFSFFDFTNPSSLGASDAEMYDGIHSGEWLQLLIHREMVLALPDILGDYADVATLDTWLAQSDDPFHVNTSP
jgi:hypothetical protein